ncbi:MAG: hypothetical protein ACLFUC_11540 [Bacteroidales bacterium]
MTYNDALKAVKGKNCAAFAIKNDEKEIFVIEYNSDPGMYSDTIIWYSKFLDNDEVEEDNMPPSDFEKEFPESANLEFTLMKKEGIDALNSGYEEAKKILRDNIL